MNLTNAHLSPGQARSLLTQVADGSNLSSLKISENDLSSVPGIIVAPFFVVSETMLASANVLAKAVNSIQEVELTKCGLTIYQVPIRNKYFQQQKNHRLKEPKRCR